LELETLNEPTRNANARIHIGFEKHTPSVGASQFGFASIREIRVNPSASLRLCGDMNLRPSAFICG
jgi:hypothetical protein